VVKNSETLISVGEPINGGFPEREESLRETIVRAVEDQKGRPQPLPEPPAPENKSHDYAGIGMFELLGLMCGLPPSEALYHGEPIDFRMVCFIVAGIVFGGLGTAWPVVRKRFPQQALVLSVSRIAADARYWLAIILVAFLYGAAPDIYRRATRPAVADQGSIDALTKQVSQLSHDLMIVSRERDSALTRAINAARERDTTKASQPNLGRTGWSNLFNSFTQPGQLKQLSGWWVIVTAPPENAEAEKELNDLFMLSSNLSHTLRLAGLPDYSRDLDAPKLEGKGLRGITVHGRNDAADFIAAALSNCFVVLRTADTPAGLFDYYHRQSTTAFSEDKFVWLEIGNGSPWKGNCRG
jgi:hypothetical protein